MMKHNSSQYTSSMKILKTPKLYLKGIFSQMQIIKYIDRFILGGGAVYICIVSMLKFQVVYKEQLYINAEKEKVLFEILGRI